jgi:hypothetical protein
VIWDNNHRCNDTITQEIFVDDVVGIPSIEKTANQPRLVPNPTKNRVTIEGIDPSNIDNIVDLDLKGTAIQVARQSNQVDVSALTAGTYLVRLTTIDKGVHEMKLVKR